MDHKIKTVADLEIFLGASKDLDFQQMDRVSTYAWTNKLLKRFHYHAESKKRKGILKHYIAKMTGYSDRQVKRLIKEHFLFGGIKIKKSYNRYRFQKTYTREDIDLLIKTDNLHNRLNGLATKKIFEMEYRIYGKQEYKRLAGISISHIYNFRKTRGYQKKALTYTKTNPRKVNIGERQRPNPEGKPGYIRVDSVHQGDSDKQKGVYYINAVDEVTQWQVVAAVEKISETYLLDALLDLLAQFPFVIIEFHSDNGSEYINRQVSALLNKLLIKLTKSRSRQCNDNALVESKNGAVIRKWMGYAYIPQKSAKKINQFFKAHFNLYINCYRPSIFPEIILSRKNKEIKKYKYKNTMTPFEKLKVIPNFRIFLKPSFPLLDLETFLSNHSVNDYTERMVKAQDKLFDGIFS
ncbi:MAG: putative integrase catalytic subunit [Ignavibacteria bacterium]|nr:MAG: putative integrase catalytic subunit [Ignavibacteria bacterium]KAF0150969.1 MAG: putative integrase catalytic subunit [Ignavibacteria bacterium]